MAFDAEHNRWRGENDNIYISANGMSPSRMGEPEIVVETAEHPNAEGTLASVTPYVKSENHGISYNGSFKIAEKGNVPVIPMTIVNSSAVFEDQYPKIKKVTVIIDYGKPIYLSDLDRETKKNIGSYVSGIMQETYFRMKDEYAAELGSTTQK